MRTSKFISTIAVMAIVVFTSCSKDEQLTDLTNSDATLLKSMTLEAVPLGSASTFAVLAATTVTNAEASILNGDLGVSPGTAITGFQPAPFNTIEGPGTVTTGLGLVTGTIYAGGPVAAQAQVDAAIAYNYLIAQVPDVIYGAVYQLDGQTFTPGIYNFPSSANLQVGGILTLDFQGNSDAVFIFQLGSTLVTMTNSNVVAINTGTSTCLGSNVYWAVGSSATIDGDSFIGSVIAYTTITMSNAGNISGATNVSGRMIALGGEVTMVKSIISVCGITTDPGDDTIIVPPVDPCEDFVTGGGWIKGTSDCDKHGKRNNTKATFGVSGGIKHGEFWGQLSFVDHGKDGLRVKSTSVTAYNIIDEVTREIKGVAKVNGRGSFTYTVIVKDNGEPGRNDFFSLVLSNGYQVSGTLNGGGNIQIHIICDDSHDNHGHDKYYDKDEDEGHRNCNNGNGR